MYNENRNLSDSIEKKNISVTFSKTSKYDAWYENGVVEINVFDSNSYSFSAGWNYGIGSVPSQYLPTAERRFFFSVSREGNVFGMLTIRITGNIDIFCMSGTTNQGLYGTARYRI